MPLPATSCIGGPSLANTRSYAALTLSQAEGRRGDELTSSRQLILLLCGRAGAILKSKDRGKEGSMTRVEIVSRLTMLAVCVLTIACDSSDTCTRSRNEVAKTWESVKNLATKRKFPLDDEVDNPIIKQQRQERWLR